MINYIEAWFLLLVQIVLRYAMIQPKTKHFFRYIFRYTWQLFFPWSNGTNNDLTCKGDNLKFWFSTAFWSLCLLLLILFQQSPTWNKRYRILQSSGFSNTFNNFRYPTFPVCIKISSDEVLSTSPHFSFWLFLFYPSTLQTKVTYICSHIFPHNSNCPSN